MELKHLTNDILETRLEDLVKKEREILSDVIRHIAEVDRRRLYLQRAYPSLFEYLTQKMGYSAGSAQRRIDAARLFQNIPELPEKLESGHINLTQVSLIQKAQRQVLKTSPSQKPSKETQRELLHAMEGMTFQQSQTLVAQTFNLEIQEDTRIKYQADESVRFEVSLTKEQWQKLEKMRTLLSNSLPSGSWDEVLEYISDKVIQQKIKPLKTGVIDKALAQKVKTKGPGYRQPITPQTRTAVLTANSSCNYMDPRTKRLCKSKWRLHIDHIKPIWAGGTNDLSNLRTLCANHNRELYRQQANIVSL